MNTIKSSSQLKANAREYLFGHYSQVIPAQFLFFLFSAFLSLFSPSGAATTLLLLLISFLVSFICNCNIELIRFGLYRMYMNMCCGYRFGTWDLTYGLFDRSRKSIQISILFTGIQYLCLLPFTIFLYFYSTTQDVRMLLAGSISFIIGFPLYYLISLSWSQAFFLLLDFPGKSIRELLRLSCWMMKGQKLRLFYIQISFLPLLLLGILSCGLGLLWVVPYMDTTYTCFHLNLASVKAGE